MAEHQDPSGVSGAGDRADGAGGLDPELLAFADDDGEAGGVLIVDDNEQNVELLYAYMEDLGVPIRTAGDGYQALTAFEEQQPDIVLLDVMMPRMSGFQLCERLKGDPKTRDVPIVMVTALGEAADIERADEAGADDFLTKPVNKIELLMRVRSLMEVRRMRRVAERALERMRSLRDREGLGGE